MITTTSIVLHNASKATRCLSERLGRERGALFRWNPLNKGTSSPLSVGMRTYSGHADDPRLGPYPQPLPCEDYAYDYGHDQVEEGSTGQASGGSSRRGYHQVAPGGAVKRDAKRALGISRDISSAAGPTGRGRPPSSTYPLPSIPGKASKPAKDGGGGSGRHRCPKCGTTASFRLEHENTFYCARCSGCFVVNPDSIFSVDPGTIDGSPGEDIIAKNKPRNPDDPEIRHVRTNVPRFYWQLLLTPSSHTVSVSFE